MKVICILQGGETFKIKVGSRMIYFEMHTFCGPMAISKNGNEIKTPSGFYKAVTLWIKQGKRVENGIALWNRPKPYRLEDNATQIIGNHWMMKPGGKLKGEE